MSVAEHLVLIGIVGSNLVIPIYEHIQSTPSDRITINHGLNTGIVRVWGFDSVGKVFTPSFVVLDENSVRVDVNPAVSGVLYVAPYHTSQPD